MSNVEDIMGHTAAGLTALEVADYLIASVDGGSGDNITHLKLQKLLYYAQGFHVAMCDGKPLFSESVLAWTHGPVVRRVYSKYRGLEWHPISPKTVDIHKYAPEDRELLDAVYLKYGQFGAWKLEEMTHEESPWAKTRQQAAISLDLLREYFTPMVEAGRKNRSVNGRPVWPMNSFRFQGRKELALLRKPSIHRSRLKAMSLHGSIDGD
jgi:uncharacterized phage-associated protein